MDQNGWVDAREQSRVQRGENNVHIDEDRPPAFGERDKLLVETGNSRSSQLAGICPLVAHDDLVTGRIVPGEPWITIKPMSNLNGNAERSFSTLTKLRLVSIPSNVDRDEGRVCIAFLATRPGYDVRDVAGDRRGIPGVRLERCNFGWGQRRDDTFVIQRQSKVGRDGDASVHRLGNEGG